MSVLYLQTEISRLYMEKYNMTSEEFLKLDEEYGILDMLEYGYDSFESTGTLGVLEEVENFVANIEAKNARNKYKQKMLAAGYTLEQIREIRLNQEFYYTEGEEVIFKRDSDKDDN